MVTGFTLNFNPVISFRIFADDPDFIIDSEEFFFEIASLDLSKNSQLLHLDCDDNCIEILDVSTTQLNHYVPKTIVYSEYPLKCKMASLKALYLKRDWRLKGINDTFPVCIARNTQIIYK